MWLELNGSPACSWLCTPTRLDALACGWLVGEGLIGHLGELLELEAFEAELRVRARTAARTAAHTALDRRPLSTGPAGERFDLERRVPLQPVRPIPDPHELMASGRLRAAFRELFAGCALRDEGGGVHSGGLLTESGVSHIVEDVGRHNVMDKVIGSAMMADTPREGRLILLSGRVSAEIAVKAWRAGIGGVATLSVPTSLARAIARRAGVWLIGRSLKESAFVYEPGGEG